MTEADLPGLLQTEDYVRAMLASGRPRRTPEQIANDVQVRLIRQQRLENPENSLDLVAVVDEASLLREVGGADVMRSQLRHLIEVSELPTVNRMIPTCSMSSTRLAPCTSRMRRRSGKLD